MMRAGTLERALRDAAESSVCEMAELMAVGFTEAEAWPMVREEYIILPEEAPLRRASSLLGEIEAAARGDFD